jgi:hypothetical protein
MTEAEWPSCDDPDRMLAFLARPPGDRAGRWFAAAACRRVEEMASHAAVSEAIALAEVSAEGPVSPERQAAASAAAFAVWREFRRPNSARHAAGAAARAVGDDEVYPRLVADWVRVAAGHRAAEGSRPRRGESRRGNAARSGRRPVTRQRSSRSYPDASERTGVWSRVGCRGQVCAVRATPQREFLEVPVQSPSIHRCR